ncbi:MAG: hypothetical protein KKB52_00330 [Candidatus Omnitrophica bacterium]|nr:hypothetical protein [Candidatus Omnitrophota bacterium]
MKKITVLVQSKDMDPALKTMGARGVLHIEHQNAPHSDDIAVLEEKLNHVSRAIEILPDLEKEKHVPAEPEKIVSEILHIAEKKEISLENMKKINRDIDAWKEWGDFDPEVMDDLKDKGIWVRLCKISKNELDGLPENVITEVLLKKRKIFYCAVISREEVNLPFKSLSLPDIGLQEMHGLKMREEEGLKTLGKRLKDLAVFKKALNTYRNELESLVNFNRAMAGAGRHESISYLVGYCPSSRADMLQKLAEKEKWGIVIEEPAESDKVPTLIKNPRWVEIIKPVFSMIKTIPGYKELDISFWFLLFFSVFFGMLVGDAGYGILFLLLNLIAHIRLGKSVRDKSIFFLTYVLSVSTIIWGFFTGTFFGQAYLQGKLPALLPYLTDNSNVQNLCFLIGAIHLSIAHAWRFIRKAPSLKAFAEAGWIAMLWAAYFIAKALILGGGFSRYGKWFLISGASLIILFTEPRKNIFKAIGLGIGSFLLHAMNSFTDVVSYIRLFAVGAASVAVADAFNNIAMTMGYGSFISGLMTALILLLGHTLNILLGAMAVLVHGMRLNLLEFSSHLDMEWSGVEYKPFSSET